MLEEAFGITTGPSSAPDILLFKRFKAFWPNIVFSDYKPGTEVPAIAKVLTDMLADMKTFLSDQLDMNHQRKVCQKKFTKRYDLIRHERTRH